jgi:hypothetical protein
MKIVQIFKTLLAVILALSVISCSPVNSQENNLQLSQQFKDYWYAGKAELTRYDLQQARYGEIRHGDAVLIFVTEDFDKEKQVKHESGDDQQAISVLKLNLTKNFVTGIYPYSLMSSIFTPVDKKSTLKVTSSTQEWCGHSFSQLNLRGNKYQGHLYSYFQQEGDQEFSIDDAWLEDEIWTMLRIQPTSLPVGEIQLLPGTQYLRLKHHPFTLENAAASLEKVGNSKWSRYRVEYQDIPRVLEITFETEFPHTVEAWEEHSTDRNGVTLVTKAHKTHSINRAYWSLNHNADSVLRKDLGLDLK